MSDEPEFKQDPALPPGWFAWSTGGLVGTRHWHARPPGPPIPANYVHGDSHGEVAGKAWLEHKKIAQEVRK